MRWNMMVKMMVVAGLTIALLIPLGLVEGLIHERAGRQNEVVEEVSRQTSGAQRLTGPVLVLPWRKKRLEKEVVQIWQTCGAESHADPQVVALAKAACMKAEKKSGEALAVAVEKTKEVWDNGTLVLPPTTLAVQAHLGVQTVYRGLYAARTWRAPEATMAGRFDFDLGELGDDPEVQFSPAYVVVPVSDVRGLPRSPTLKWGTRELGFRPDNPQPWLGAGVHAMLPEFDPRKAGSVPFEVRLELLGTAALYVTPTGRDTKVAIASDWPHPSFIGDLLPAHREVDEAGFRASWQTSFFANNLGSALRDRDGETVRQKVFGVHLVEPVNTYSQTERATEYGILFVLLTFATFFLFEQLAGVRIHPLQYALVGAALATFYLLLVALSEHVPFADAYLAAAGACVGLCTFYVRYVLGGWLRGLGFGGGLAALYGALFGVLQSEDHALLLGAGLVFVVLAAAMVLTRRVDWYALQEAATAPVKPVVPPPPGVHG
ncbi:MAG: cell envelope integrity protein CreD [Deltaproteobacteria bacterium]|nr:cell envelope integrity protein CreD [Deltaproteobacteria bacterium]